MVLSGERYRVQIEEKWLLDKDCGSAGLIPTCAVGLTVSASSRNPLFSELNRRENFRGNTYTKEIKMIARA